MRHLTSVQPPSLTLLICALVLMAACFRQPPPDDATITASTLVTVTPAPTTPTATPRQIEAPSPTATPSPIPSPTPTFAPSPTPTTTATPEPTSTPIPADEMVNLRPLVPLGWDSPIIAANHEGSRQSTPLSVDTPTYLSIAIVNDGVARVEGHFYVDLYFDGTLVERWKNEHAEPDFASVVIDWTGLDSRVRVESGPHTLKLVLDPTNLIIESDDADNVFEKVFEWEPPSDIEIRPETPVERLPDLAAFPPGGWESPIVATSYGGDFTNGPLSIDEPTHVLVGIKNVGRTSIDSDIWAHLYLDDMLVDTISWNGLLAGQVAKRSEWDGLHDVVNIEPGIHTLKLVIDPANLIKEANEDNNVFESRFVWETGDVPERPTTTTPTPAPTRTPLPLPNLVPGWKFGDDGPIIVSHREETTLDGPLSIDNLPFVDVVIQNQSRIPTEGELAIDLYFDDQMVKKFKFTGKIPPGTFMRASDWEDLADTVEITEGPHTLRIEIDPDNRFDETDETDNSFEKTFVWGSGQLQPTQFVSFTKEELEERLSDIASVVELRGDVAADETGEVADKILSIADAAYYLMTGKSIQDERLEIFLLDHEGYVDWIDAHFDERSALARASSQAALDSTRQEFKDTHAFKTRRFGRFAIVVDAERSPAEVLGSIAHELGHVRQDILNPSQTEAKDFFYLDAIQEAQAQQFERALWQTVDDFTGAGLLTYPDFDVFRAFLGNKLDFWVEDMGRDDHSLGYLLQHLAVLDDPELKALKQEIDARGQLSAGGSLALFDYLVALEVDEIAGYVRERLDGLEAHVDAMKEIARSRLERKLDPVEEGHPALVVPALLSP